MVVPRIDIPCTLAEHWAGSDTLTVPRIETTRKRTELLLVEAIIVGHLGEHGPDELLRQVLVTEAGHGHLWFGKGNHPAGLNFGDCCSDALSKTSNKPLLFKGNDFSQTDVTKVAL